MSDFRALALPVAQPPATFYLASIKVTELETICRPLLRPSQGGVFGRDISEPVKLSEEQLSALLRSLESKGFQSRASGLLAEERIQPYQRFLDERRAVEIAKYIQQPSGLLPNSIILAVNVALDEDELVRQLKDGVVELTLPRREDSAVILDGQHRVAAFKYLDAETRARFEVAVTFLVGVPFYQQAEIFAVINGKQKPVNKSIIYDLFGYAPIGDAKEERLYEGLMAVSRFCSHVTRILNRVEESPWKNQVRMRGPGDVGVISQAAVVEYLSALVEPKTFTRRLKVLPLLYSFFKEGDAPGCASVLILYLAAIRAALPEQWGNRKSLLWKNNGVAVALRLLHDQIMLAGSPESLMENYQRLVAFWKSAPLESVNNPPKAGGGGIQNQLYDEFRSRMFTGDDLARIDKMRSALKDKLLATGGLVQ
jgi:DGQHR domain-containing protein